MHMVSEGKICWVLRGLSAFECHFLQDVKGGQLL